MRTKAPIRLAAPLLALCLAACGMAGDTRDPDALGFPKADRPISQSSALQFSTEIKRDAAGEAREVMDRAGIAPGMSVADIGAGKGYYAARLSERVGPGGRVLAQDIDPQAIEMLATRVQRERLDNVSVVTGRPANPRLPAASFDRVLLIHMYHEVAEPYAFAWRIWPALKPGGEVIVVDQDRPTDQHGIPPRLLFCEMEAVGFELLEFVEQPELDGYFVRFRRKAERPEPEDVVGCRSVTLSG